MTPLIRTALLAAVALVQTARAAQAGRHPVGAPIDLAQDGQGRLWITEDRNGSLLLAPVR